jgi:hypothetical protein
MKRRFHCNKVEEWKQEVVILSGRSGVEGSRDTTEK